MPKAIQDLSRCGIQVSTVESVGPHQGKYGRVRGFEKEVRVVNYELEVIRYGFVLSHLGPETTIVFRTVNLVDLRANN